MPALLPGDHADISFLPYIAQSGMPSKLNFEPSPRGKNREDGIRTEPPSGIAGILKTVALGPSAEAL
jgi:hypothetical protein